MGPPPAVAALRTAVRRCLTDLPTGALVLVAGSGGADSTALAAATAYVARRRGLRAGFVTVDHGWRADSAERAQQVCRAAARLALDPALVLTAPAPRKEGPARDARRTVLAGAAERLGAAAVLLGHTLDDQAETVLLRLARGSGARSLAAMPEQAGLFRRPLLGLRRDLVRQAAADLGLDVWDDPSNADPAFARARVRSDLLPAVAAALGPGAVPALARSAELLRADADALDDAAAGYLAQCEAAGDDPLLVEPLTALPPAVRSRVLRSRLLALGCPATALTAAHVGAVERLINDWHGQGPVSLPGGSLARRVGRGNSGRIELVPGQSLAVPPPLAGAPPAGSAPPDVHPDIDQVLVTRDQLATRIKELAAAVDEDYAGREVLLVGVLKGAVMLMADLSRALGVPTTMEFMAVSSYGSATSSSGVVRILKDLDRAIDGAHVLVVEDVIDSGLTLSWLVKNLRSRHPASVEVLAMLRKPEATKIDVPVRYVGFDIPNAFVVGYGLDYAERYRTLPYVGTLRPEVIAGSAPA